MISDGEKLSGAFWTQWDRHYAGWVPNAAAQLSFSVIGGGTPSGKFASYNEVFEPTFARVGSVPSRLIVLHQRRVAQDFNLPDWLTSLVYPDAQHDYFLVARSTHADVPYLIKELAGGLVKVEPVENAQGALAGTIRVMLRNRSKAFRRKQDGFCRSFHGALFGKAVDVQKQIDGALLDASKDGVRFAEAEFVLFRSGEFRLLGKDGFGLLSNSNESFEDHEARLAEAIFQFVKDATHRHYHHDSRSDRMLSLTPTHKSPSPEASEIDWRRETLWGMVRTITQFRRKMRWGDLNKATGILAYAQAFQHNFADWIRSANKPGFETSVKLSKYDFSHMSDSIKSSIEENQARRMANWQALTLLVAVILAFFAAISSSTSKLLTLCNNSKETLFEWLASARLRCDGYHGDGFSDWELAALNRPLLLLIIIALVMFIVRDVVLLDRPLPKSTIGRIWGNIRWTGVFLCQAVHTSLVGADPFRWFKANEWVRQKISSFAVYSVIGLLLYLEAKFLFEGLGLSLPIFP